MPPKKRLKTTTLLSPLDAASSLDAATEQLLAAQDAETRQTAARAIAAACDKRDEDDESTSRDALCILVLMLRGSPDDVEASALALWKLARNLENKVSIARAAAIPLLVALLENGTDVAKEKAAAALSHLATNVDNRVSITAAGAIPLLVALLQNGTAGATEEAEIGRAHV